MKPWLETWRSTLYADIHYLNEPRGISECVPGAGSGESERASFADRATLAAAAPEMCRALLAVEWASGMWCCPMCKMRSDHGHHDCSLDATLTKAGLPGHASRDAARKEMGI